MNTERNDQKPMDKAIDWLNYLASKTCLESDGLLMKALDHIVLDTETWLGLKENKTHAWRYKDRVIINLGVLGYWWQTTDETGRCWIDEDNDRLIIGSPRAGYPYKPSYHQEKLERLSVWDKTAHVVSVTEVGYCL